MVGFLLVGGGQAASDGSDMKTIWNGMAAPGQGDLQQGDEAGAPQTVNCGELHSLTPDQVRLVDEALTNLGPFGEVRLIKEKGRLRFIQILESKSAL